ncbi:MAG: DUF975 family protein [Treponema sp.]|nr:DUF975 family protein [Treponema sp.]
MFRRVEYKKAAKEQLKGRWKVPVLSTLLALVLFSIIYGAPLSFFTGDMRANFDFNAGLFDFDFSSKNGAAFLSVFACLVWAAFCLAQLRLFDFMSKEPGGISFSDFVEGLGQWWQAVRGALWQWLWIWLWSLLFFIPGIVKWYSYSMMFCVMAENPKIGVMKAMDISKELTRGYKGDLFFTDITFIPLVFLCCLSCGLGFLWFFPYYQATRVNIYHELKKFALASGRIEEKDFN